MATTSKDVYAAGSVHYSGTRFDGNNSVVPVTPSDTPSTWTAAHLDQTSYNTPGLWKKVKWAYKFSPKKGGPRPPKIPSEIHARIPRPVLPRSFFKTERSWNRAHRRHDLLMTKYEAKRLRLKALYKLATEKYTIRLAKYNAYLEKVRNGRIGMKRTRIKLKTINIHNPYLYSLVGSTGYRGQSTTHGRFWALGNPVRYDLYYDGVFGNSFAPSPLSPWPSSALNECMISAGAAAEAKARSRYNEQLSDQKVHIANMVAERLQTYNLLAESVTRLISFVRGFSFPKLANTLYTRVFTKRGTKLVSNDVLAFLFGVKPLMEDVRGAAEAIAHMQVDNLLSDVHIKAKAKSSDSCVDVTVVNGVTYTVRSTVTVRTSYTLEFSLENAATRELSKLGLIDPLEVIWELTPWSFVVDWVLPIGDWIANATNSVGLEFRMGSQMTKTTIVQQYTASKVGVDPYTPVYWGSEEWQDFNFTNTFTSVKKERTILLDKLDNRFPDFKSPVSFYHVLESLALLRQRFR